MDPCRVCGHRLREHVTGGFVHCRFRDCRCTGFEIDLPDAPAEGDVTRDRVFVDVERALRTCFPDRCEELIAALERRWPPDADEAADDPPPVETVPIAPDAPVRWWCSRCAREIPEPSTTQMVDYARFWRGRCPACETPLRRR